MKFVYVENGLDWLWFLHIQVHKNLLKSRDFQEECILSAIQVLSAHFAQWSYHVSLPEVATIPLFLLKRLHEQITVESLRRPIKRLIDQVSTQSEIPFCVGPHPCKICWISRCYSAKASTHCMEPFKTFVKNIECEYMQHLCSLSCYSYGLMEEKYILLFEWIAHLFLLPYFWWLVQLLKSQVNENKDFIERKREVVSFSPNDKASVDSFLQVGSAQLVNVPPFLCSLY